MSPCFYVFKAGAGSGKTFNLVLQYLSMALASPTHKGLFRHILAITFTNKAAGEMKERILSTLVALANGTEKKGYTGELIKMLNVDDKELQRRARKVRNAVLHNYSDLSVCTIDSFMVRVARTFSHDLNIGHNVSVELDNKYVSQYIVDQLMMQVGPQQDITNLVCQYGEARMDEGKTTNLIDALQSSAADLFKEEAAQRLTILSKYNYANFSNSHDELVRNTRNYEETCVKKAYSALAACDEQELKSTDFAGGNNSGIYLWLKKVMDGKSYGTLGANAQKMYDDPAHTLNPSATGNKGDTPDKLLAVQDIVWQAIKYVKEGARLYNTQKALLVHLFDVALMSEMRRLLDEYFKENEVISLTEVSNRISQEIKDQPAPFLFERLGDHYRHFLIDEFQDTSREQWHNLLPLILNGISGGMRSLVVGDAKQAIYRFRNGDVRQFVDLPKVMPFGDSALLPEYRQLEYAYSHKELNRNFRTLSNVVKFNNTFFAYLIKQHYTGNDLLQRIYLGSDKDTREPELCQKFEHEGGYVKLTFWQQNDVLSAAVLDEVIRQHEKGYAYGDITILADRNDDLGKLSDYLTSHRGKEGHFLRVASSESLLLSGSLVIRLLRCLLNYLLRPTERQLQLQILEYLRQLGLRDFDDYVELFNRQVEIPSYRHDKENTTLEKYSFNLTEYLQSTGFPDFDPQHLIGLSLYDCIEELIRCFHLTDRDTAFVATLLNFTSDYVQLHHQDLSTFLEYFDKKWDKLSCNAAEDNGAVRLMTVHKSKGLESPIIIYLMPLPHNRTYLQWVDVDKKVSGIALGQVTLKKNVSTAFDDVLTEEQQNKEMDDVNRLYVALTRSRDKLIVIAEEKAPTKENKSGTQKNDAPVPLSEHLNNFAKEYSRKEEVTSANDVSYMGNTPHNDDASKDDIALPKGAIHQEDVTLQIEDTLLDTSVHGTQYYFGRDEVKKTDFCKDILVAPVSHNLHSVSFPKWNDRIFVADQSIEVLGGMQSESIRYGLLMHDLLSQIRHSDDVTSAVSQYACIHELDDSERKSLLFRIENIVNGIETGRFFADDVDVRNECALIHGGKELRPDRIVFTKDTAYIVDFKTGKPSSQYAHQVRNYCSAVQAIRNIPVEGYLLYISDDTHLERVV